MTVKPDFSAMTTAEMRAYVLEHRDDQEALQVFLDKAHSDNPNPRTYGPNDNISEVISEYIEKKRQKGAL